MKISYSFYSAKDLSDLTTGENLLEILCSNGLIIEKASDKEPIRESFNVDEFPLMWKGVGVDGGYQSCCFLFKGQKDIRFSGMVSWILNIHPNSKAFNGIDLQFNIPKSYDTNKLIKLGDDIFTWCKAEYGYISENSKLPTPINIHEGLAGLMWVNYFGPSYIVEPDFHIPDDNVPVNHGARITLAGKPNDEILENFDFQESIKNKIGAEWFSHYPIRRKRKKLVFDKSEILR